MSNIQYGLISRIDSNAIEKTFDLIAKDFPHETINYLEIGLYHGATTKGVKEYLESKGLKYNLTGIDNYKDKEPLVHLPKEVKLIEGSSIEVYNQIEDESQHFCFIDSNHSFPYVIADYYCYSPKVKVGGFLCFHDAAPQSQFKSWQRMGSESDPDTYVAVRKALTAIGLLKLKGKDINLWEYATGYRNVNWELIFDEYDKIEEGGGVIILKRLY